MRKVLVFAFALALFMPAVASAQLCRQDQFGNQYNFTIDQAHKFVFGTVTNAQGCPGGPWPLTGSYTTGPLVLELTAANPEGAGGCVTIYKLKGNYPNFAWYYETGYGAQESAYVDCGAAPAAKPEEGGARKDTRKDN
jgi:hypothetical protein